MNYQRAFLSFALVLAAIPVLAVNGPRNKPGLDLDSPAVKSTFSFLQKQAAALKLKSIDKVTHAEKMPYRYDVYFLDCSATQMDNTQKDISFTVYNDNEWKAEIR